MKVPPHFFGLPCLTQNFHTQKKKKAFHKFEQAILFTNYLNNVLFIYGSVYAHIRIYNRIRAEIFQDIY